jgi:hypothetical protein
MYGIGHQIVILAYRKGSGYQSMNNSIREQNSVREKGNEEEKVSVCMLSNHKNLVKYSGLNQPTRS